MAENTVSTLVPFGNQNDPIHISFLDGKVPAVSSIDVARHFSKKHQHVLRDIKNLIQIVPISFNESNFGRVDYVDAKGEKRPAYLLTREAFSLLVMGFTGRAAIRWKLAYIEAFNALEKQASISREEHQRLLSLARESGYRQGLEETLALPATRELMERIRLEGVEQGRKLQKRQDGYTQTMKAIGYLQRGAFPCRSRQAVRHDEGGSGYTAAPPAFRHGFGAPRQARTGQSYGGVVMMDFRSENPGDISAQLHARIRFLSLATLAIGSLDEGTLADALAWEGFFYFTQDLLDLTAVLKEKTA